MKVGDETLKMKNELQIPYGKTPQTRGYILPITAQTCKNKKKKKKTQILILTHLN